jgi:hypothetical protein
MTRDFQKQAITLIDDLKGVCANYGLGNDGNEFKIITQKHGAGPGKREVSSQPAPWLDRPAVR